MVVTGTEIEVVVGFMVTVEAVVVTGVQFTVAVFVVMKAAITSTRHTGNQHLPALPALPRPLHTIHLARACVCACGELKVDFLDHLSCRSTHIKGNHMDKNEYDE